VYAEVIERDPLLRKVATTWNVKGIFVVRGSIGYLRIYSSTAPLPLARNQNHAKARCHYSLDRRARERERYRERNQSYPCQGEWREQQEQEVGAVGPERRAIERSASRAKTTRKGRSDAEWECDRGCADF
jgi:hypothetical protein